MDYIQDAAGAASQAAVVAEGLSSFKLKAVWSCRGQPEPQSEGGQRLALPHKMREPGLEFVHCFLNEPELQDSIAKLLDTAQSFKVGSKSLLNPSIPHIQLSWTTASHDSNRRTILSGTVCCAC